jgi:hypothetical protein
VTDTAVREAFATLEQAFADPACETGDLEPGVRALQELLIARKNAEAERRDEIIEQGRKRWGRNYALTSDETGEVISAYDSDGSVIAREDWDAFRDYVIADRQAWADAGREAADRWCR